MGHPGQQTLFKEIFVAERTVQTLRQGRSEELINQRNECLVDRYYYLGRETGKRYDLLLEQLRREFFIETVTIAERIGENRDQLEVLKRQRPDRDYFAAKWPHLVW